MALAPLQDPREHEPLERAPLRLVPGGRPAAAPPRRTAVHARRDVTTDQLLRSRAAHPTAATRAAAPPATRDLEQHAPTPALAVQQRRQRAAAVKAQTASRRRRSATILVVALTAVLLALPLRGLGAVTVSGQATPGGAPGGLADGSVYVVQPGDTLRSIALQINPSDVGPLVSQLAAEVGSRSVVAGEHVTVP